MLSAADLTPGAATIGDWHARIADRDDSAVAQSIELMLKSESFNVYTTDLGEEGVDLGKLYDYDIILLDELPDMSGYDVLKQLRVSKISPRFAPFPASPVSRTRSRVSASAPTTT